MTDQPENPEDIVWFPSAVDTWLAVLLGTVVLVALASFVAAVIAAPGTAWVALLPLFLIAAVYRGLVLPTQYGVDREHLVIRFGLVRQRIPLETISAVRPSRSILSSPALSLNRLSIRCGMHQLNTALISPADRDGFLDLLSRRTGLTRQGDSLELRPGAAPRA